MNVLWVAIGGALGPVAVGLAAGVTVGRGPVEHEGFRLFLIVGF